MSVKLLSNSVNTSLNYGLAGWNHTQQFCGHTWSIANGGIRPLCTALNLGGRLSELLIELFPSLDCAKSLKEVSAVCLGTRSLLSGFIVFYDLSPSTSQGGSPRQKRFIQVNNNVHWGLSKITSTLAPVSTVLAVLSPKGMLLVIVKQANKLSLFFYHGTKVTKLVAASSSEKKLLHKALNKRSSLREELKEAFAFSSDRDLNAFLESVEKELRKEYLPATRISHAFTSACETTEKTDQLFKSLFGESSFEDPLFSSLSKGQIMEELLTGFYAGNMGKDQIEFLAKQLPEASEKIREGESSAIKHALNSLIKVELSERHALLSNQECANEAELEQIERLLENDNLELVDNKFAALENPALLRESILKRCSSESQVGLTGGQVDHLRSFGTLKKYITNNEKIEKHSHQMNENTIAALASIADLAVCTLAYTVAPSALLCAALSSTSAITSTTNWFYKRTQPSTPFADADERILKISRNIRVTA